MTKAEKTAGALLERARPLVRALEGADAPGFNILDTLGLGRDEAGAHSKLIFRLLSDAGGFGQLLLRRLRIPTPEGKWAAHREYAIPGGRIDFVMESAEFLLAVEMKIDAGDQDAQLERYDAFCKSRGKDYLLCYLTPYGTEPGEQSVGTMDRSRLRLLSLQRDIAGWLEDCLTLAEPGGFKHSYITQYLGAIRYLTEGDGGMEKAKDLVVSGEDARAALLVYESFQRKMEDVITQLMRGLTARLEAKTGRAVYLREDLLGEFYHAAHPYLYMEIDSVEVKGDTVYFLAGAGIEPSWFYGYFQFCRGSISDPTFLSLAEAEKTVPAFYQKWMERIAGLQLPFVKTEKYSKYFALENSKGEPIEFRVNTPPNQAALDLIDHLEPEVDYISSLIANRMIFPILPESKGGASI